MNLARTVVKKSTKVGTDPYLVLHEPSPVPSAGVYILMSCYIITVLPSCWSFFFLVIPISYLSCCQDHYRYIIIMVNRCRLWQFPQSYQVSYSTTCYKTINNYYGFKKDLITYLLWGTLQVQISLINYTTPHREKCIS